MDYVLHALTQVARSYALLMHACYTYLFVVLNKLHIIWQTKKGIK